MRRVFIADPMAVHGYGHNVQSLVFFADAFADKGFLPVVLHGIDVPNMQLQKYKNTRTFKYPYEGFIPKNRIQFKNRRLTAILSKFFRRLNKLKEILLYRLTQRDRWIEICARDWERAFLSENITEKDLIFLPNADFYGILGLLTHIRRRNLKCQIHFRKIGVMEYASYISTTPLVKILNAINAIKDSKISLSAEVPRYARYLSQIYDRKVEVLSYPPNTRSITLNWGDKKVICSPGQGREDKGFFKIKEIERELAFLDPEQRFQIVLQDMNYFDERYSIKYSKGLANTPNIKLLPSTISGESIEELYRIADIIILPYDEKTYLNRGSAVYQEGLSAGKLFVAFGGTGIDELILKYGNGRIVKTPKKMAKEIVDLWNLDIDSLREITRTAAEKYEFDFNASIDWIINQHE